MKTKAKIKKVLGSLSLSIAIFVSGFGIALGQITCPLSSQTDLINVIEKVQGEQFKISLPENPSTGYSWEVNYDTCILRLDNHVYTPEGEQAIGSGGSAQFTFTALEEGLTLITFSLKRPWETEVLEQKQILVSIKKKSKSPDAQYSVHVGDSFEVALGSNPSTGYSWEISSIDGNMLEMSAEDFIPSPIPMVGSSGSQVFTLKALEKGTTEIIFIYKRPWDDDSVSAEKVIRINIQ